MRIDGLAKLLTDSEIVDLHPFSVVKCLVGSGVFNMDYDEVGDKPKYKFERFSCTITTRASYTMWTSRFVVSRYAIIVVAILATLSICVPPRCYRSSTEYIVTLL